MSLLSYFRDAFFADKKKDADNSDLDKDRGLRVVATMMIFGFLAIIIVAIWANAIPKARSFWAVVGLASTVSLAAVFTGGILGFLFGIPRSLQRGGIEAPSPGETADNGNGSRPYSNNTNLEQISDWLTKIIVGVGLTQLPAIQKNFNALVASVSLGFDGYINPAYSYPFSSALIIFYTICGFLLIYIWAKVYFMEQLTILEDRLNKRNIRIEVKENTARSLKLDIARLESILTEFNRTKNRILGLESTTWMNIINEANPGPITYIDDFQKGRWGGKAEADGYKVSAVVDVKGRKDGNYPIDIIVSCSDPAKSLNGNIYFFMHESYTDTEYVTVAAAINNVAQVRIYSFEAFTIGTYLQGPHVKLELDLNNCDVPPDYRYSGPLLKFEDVKGQLDAVKEEGRKKGVKLDE